MSVSKRLAAIGAVALALVGAAAFYSFAGGDGNSSVCPGSRARAAAMAPLARGEVAAVQVRTAPAPAPELAFLGPDGQALTLTAFRGKTVLVNLWATWCAPCLKEMPSLDALQGAFVGQDFALVAINIDTRNLDKPRAWLAQNGITRLSYYSDPQAKTFQVLRTAGKAEGMPVSLIVDGQGCELGIIQGPADWASTEAKALVAAALGR